MDEIRLRLFLLLPLLFLLFSLRDWNVSELVFRNDTLAICLDKCWAVFLENLRLDGEVFFSSNHAANSFSHPIVQNKSNVLQMFSSFLDIVFLLLNLVEKRE